MCLRSSHKYNVKLAKRKVNQCLETSNHINENMHPKNTAAQYLAGQASVGSECRRITCLRDSNGGQKFKMPYRSKPA